MLLLCMYVCMHVNDVVLYYSVYHLSPLLSLRDAHSSSVVMVCFIIAFLLQRSMPYISPNETALINRYTESNSKIGNLSTVYRGKLHVGILCNHGLQLHIFCHVTLTFLIYRVLERLPDDGEVRSFAIDNVFMPCLLYLSTLHMTYQYGGYMS